MKEILIGIISSIIGAIIILLFQKVIIPLYISFTSNIPKVSGKWRNNEDDNTISILEIQQFGNRVNAKLNRTSEKNFREFIYKGNMYNGVLILSWKQEKTKNYNVGTMILKLSGDLNSLTGKTVFFHHDEGKIISQEKVYNRIK